MLQKLFNLIKPKPNPNPTPHTNMPPNLESILVRKSVRISADQEKSPALRIIHAGGLVEQYYMAIPAIRIIQKYPSFILTRPDVFRRPWDAVVSPEDILIPGQKYFVVSTHTVRKLRRRIKKPSTVNSGLLSDLSQNLSDASGEETSFSSSSFSQKSEVKNSGIMIKTSIKIKPRNRRVRFCGVDSKDDLSGVTSEKGSDCMEMVEKNSPNGKRRTRNIVQWQPSLTSINEINFADE